MKRLVVISIFLLTVMSVPAGAADVLDIGTSARSIGQGRTYVGMTDVGECVFGNPAGLYGLKSPEMVSMYSELSGDVKYTLVGVAIPTGFGKLGIGYASNRVWDLFVTTLDATGRPSTSEPFSYGTDMLLMDYSNKLSDKLSYGLRLKYIDKGASIASRGKGTGMNLDLGLSYRLNEDASAGLVAENVIAGGQGAIKWNNGAEEEMPFVLNIGGKYRFNELNTTVYSDISFRKTRSYEIRLGGEWNAFKPLSLRAGMEQMNPSLAEKYMNYSLGVGIDLGDFRLDYAYYLDTLVQYNSRHYVSFAISLPKESAVELKQPEDLLGIFEKNLDEAFGLEVTVRRAEFVRAVEKTFLKKEPDKKTVSPFVDVPADSWPAPYVSLAIEKRHIAGYPDGTFRPRNIITRAEFVMVMETVFAKGKVTGKEEFIFRDVPVGHWAEKGISAARERGHIDGYPGNLFIPRKELTKMDSKGIIGRMKMKAIER